MDMCLIKFRKRQDNVNYGKKHTMTEKFMVKGSIQET